MTSKKLSELSPGEKGIVSAILAEPELADQLLELGIGLGETIAMVAKSPFGDPIVLSLMNYHLAIRNAEAEKVVLRDVK